MRLQIVSRKTPAPTGDPRVHVDLASLIRLEHKARGFNFLPRQPVHSVLSGRYASRLRGRGLDFEELRRYMPGDDIRAMDWKATARTRKPQLRVYTEERDRPVLLVVDQRISMFFGSRERMKSVTAAEAAALSAWRVLSVGDRVGALIFDDAEVSEVRPHRSQRAVMQILSTLVDFNARLRAGAEREAGPDMLNKALRHASRLVRHDALVLIVSDFSGANAETRRLITRMAEHNDLIATLIYDPLEEALPEAGRVVMSDGTRQLEVDTDDAGVRSRYAETFASRLKKARSQLASLSVPVLPLHTAGGVAEQVRDALGQAGRAGRP